MFLALNPAELYNSTVLNVQSTIRDKIIKVFRIAHPGLNSRGVAQTFSGNM